MTSSLAQQPQYITCTEESSFWYFIFRQAARCQVTRPGLGKARSHEAAKVNQNWKLLCSISDPVLYPKWISNCQMSIETIKQGSSKLAAEQCPGQGAAEEGGYWEICPSGLLAAGWCSAGGGVHISCDTSCARPGTCYPATEPAAPAPPRAQSSYSLVQSCRYNY